VPIMIQRHFDGHGLSGFCPSYGFLQRLGPLCALCAFAVSVLGAARPEKKSATESTECTERKQVTRPSCEVTGM